MATFYAEVIAKLDDSALKDLDNIKKTAEVEVKLTGEGADFIKGNMKNLTANFGSSGNKAGQNFGKQFSKGFSAATSSPKISGNPVKSYFNSRDNTATRAKEIARDYANDVAKSYKEIPKEAMKAAKAEDRIINQQAAQAEKLYSKLDKAYNTSMNAGVISSNAKSLDSARYENSKIYQDMMRNVALLDKAREGLNNELDKGFNANIEELGKGVKDVSKYSGSAERAISKITTPITELERVTAQNNVGSWLKKNNKVFRDKDLSGAIQNIQRQLGSGDLDYGQQQSLLAELKGYQSQAESLGLTGRSWFSDFKRATGQIFQFTGVYGALQGLTQELPRQMISAVADVDKAMIELQKVSSAPKQEIASYFDEAAESAKTYGATIDDVISSTADWSRLGYNFEDAKKLSDATTLIQKVGDNMTQESASEGLISTLRGFGKEADEVGHIIDSVNQVANTQPIDTAGIFEALTRSASSMSAANNTMEETIGLITAANSVVQDPASIGTAFKTMSMRIRGRIVPIYNVNYSLCYAL